MARPFRHVSWRVRSVTLDRQLTASSTVIPLPSPSEFGPSASVRAGDERTSHIVSSARPRGRDVALEAEDLHNLRVVFFSLKLDFPVAVSELVMFPPSAKDPQD